jgi:hypothetical protein
MQNQAIAFFLALLFLALMAAWVPFLDVLQRVSRRRVVAVPPRPQRDRAMSGGEGRS